MVDDGFLRRERNVAANLFPSSIAHIEYMFLKSQLHHTDLLFSLVRVTGYVRIDTEPRVVVAALYLFSAFFASRAT
jgi:hypothetical protein